MNVNQQNQLKQAVAQSALTYVKPHSIIGVGTGSTVQYFIQALAQNPSFIQGAVSSSEASTQAMKAAGIKLIDPLSIEHLDLYVDGADEIDPQGYMIKGGGAALTREKIVASMASQFVCIVDASKWVKTLGTFPVPVEIIPMAQKRLQTEFARLGGKALLRVDANQKPVITDNGQLILDVQGLQLTDPLGFEKTVNQWPGVVTVGVFALQKAHVALIGHVEGVKTVQWPAE